MTTVKKRILCIDDDEDTCTMLTAFLAQAGFEVIAAHSAAVGLDIANRETFDLYLLDLWFKDGGKTELFERIRHFDSDTPIIVYSADARQATRETLSKANVQAFLTKPKGLDTLVETIKSLTENVY
jgi:DNA-binding response OmpR family regulator